ncbi:MAG: hypothetical protein FWH04_02345 [Oscillospiraceae bacterium]|nr:hypothetical protein [Oscillospiraceae bacterium]
MGVEYLVLIIGGLIVLYFVGSRILGKLWDKGEQLLRKDTYARERELLQTVWHYKTSAPVAKIQAQLDRHLGEDIKSAQNANQINYTQYVGRERFEARILFFQKGGFTHGEFHFTSVSKATGISGALSHISDLAEGVALAFKAADPNVEVSRSQQNFKS